MASQASGKGQGKAFRWGGNRLWIAEGGGKFARKREQRGLRHLFTSTPDVPGDYSTGPGALKVPYGRLEG